MFCQEGSFVKEEPDLTTIIEFACRRWSCATCAPKLLARARAIARAGTPTALLTLTSRRGRPGSPGSHARELKHCWRLIRRKARTELTYPPSWRWLRDPERLRERRRRLRAGEITRVATLRQVRLPFFAAVEATERGEPHLHILVSGPWISQKWISHQMAELMDSPVVDIRKIDSPGCAAAYVTKYVSKQLARFAGCKRFWCSRDWIDEAKRRTRPVFDQGARWELVNDLIQNIVAWHVLEGWRVKAMTSTTAQLARAPP